MIIGDPFQLKHISNATHQQEKMLQKKWKILDYPSWWYSVNSLYDLSAGKVDRVINLLNHHRSHEDIIDFSNKQFYSGNLRILTSYRNLKLLKDGPAIRWINTSGKTERPNNGSAINKLEVKEIVKELNRLVIKERYSGSIGIVTPFRAQVELIKKEVNLNPTLESELIKTNFLVDTVD